ncbi:hypothetical protein DPEC_G00106350 [Dallia pectoralis]|uniref:Uncharacterized protein n=1 Tax=Dallia pectoralis TaxID=75939 RepID=A0ACC2GXU8_DALPE|nr:hypothetical protein DPEC_G00106350 [Dallia pectoralis]
MFLSCVVVSLLVFTCDTGEARAKLNSIRMLHPTPVTAVTRTTTRYPQVIETFQIYTCTSDLECGERSFCHAPSGNPAPKRCHTCRRRRRTCHKDAMCCPGNHCRDNVCAPLYVRGVSHRIPAVEKHPKLAHRKKGGWRKKNHSKLPVVKGHAGDACLRTSDCSEGFCCARHFWERICKPVLKQGEVCTRHHRKAQQGLELFQRCDCGEGLVCKARHLAQLSPSSSTSSPSSSSPLAPLELPEAGAAKGRLHLCQRK